MKASLEETEIREAQSRVDSLVERVESVGRALNAALGLVFQVANAEEFLEQRLFDMWEKARGLKDGLADIAARGVWDRRPLAPNDGVRRFLNSINP